MDDLKPYMFVEVDAEDLLEEQIEVEEKPTLITQDWPAYCAQLPIQNKVQIVKRGVDSGMIVDTSSSSDDQAVVRQSDFQLTDIVTKSENFFTTQNNNGSEAVTYIIIEEPCGVLDPLQNSCDLETNKNISEESTSDIEIVPSANEQQKFDALETDIKIFTPYIRKLCNHCKNISELVGDSATMKKCHKCKKAVTYCCHLCLEVSSLKDMYIHLFKHHYDEVTSIDNKKKSKTGRFFSCKKCSVLFLSPKSLQEHESKCNVLPNLFCKFCSSNVRTKREMRQHMVQMHSRFFKMNSLEKMLDEIVKEGDLVMGMLSEHYGYCTTCKKSITLNPRPVLCFTCSTKLVYRCNDPECSAQVFTEITSLQSHLRFHANIGWSIELRKSNSGNIRVCHLCGFEGDREAIKIHKSTVHHDFFECKCDLCGVNLKNVKAWRRHQAHYCPSTHQKLKCGHCSFKSFKKERLKRHLKNVHTHLYTGERPKCNKCGITWAGMYRLLWHSNSCSGNYEVEKAKQKELRAKRGVITLS